MIISGKKLRVDSWFFKNIAAPAGYKLEWLLVDPVTNAAQRKVFLTTSLALRYAKETGFKIVECKVVKK